MPRKTPQTAAKAKDAHKPARRTQEDWRIVARTRGNKAELVEISAQGNERVLKSFVGPGLPARRGERMGMISDKTGQRALQAFRLAVREAKQK